MKLRLNLLILIVLTSQFIHSQKSEMPKEQKDFMYSMKFEMLKDIFKKPEYDFKSRNLDIDKNFVKSNKTKESIISSIEYFEKNAKLEITNERTKKIKLQSNFPESFMPEKLNVISIKIEENKLFGNENIPLETLNASSTSFGINVTQSNQLSFDSKFDKNLTGEVSYRIKFITDYSSKKISKEDIGKTINLSESQYKIIDIFENKIVLKSNLKETLTINDLKIKCISLDKKGKMELFSENWSMSSSLIDEKIYQFFKENKELDIETCRNKFTFEKLMDDKLLGKYIILEVPAPIENEVILYEPIYGVNQIINVKL